MSLSNLLVKIRPSVQDKYTLMESPRPSCTLFISVCDGRQKASVINITEKNFESAWTKAAARCRRLVEREKLDVRWLRVDWVKTAKRMTWRDLKVHFKKTKRNYFRYGLAFDEQLQKAFLEQELNANAMLYGGGKIVHTIVNKRNFQTYSAKRFKGFIPDFSDEQPVYLLSTQGVFASIDEAPQELYPSGRNAGRRVIEKLDTDIVRGLIDRGSRYLASQVKPSGEFHYGWHPSFDKPIETYNSLRHASTTYAMLEAWEVTRDEALKAEIDQALEYLTDHLIKKVTLDDEDVAFLIDGGSEIKLGGNAVSLLALAKYVELTGLDKHRNLITQLALGIRYMQNPDTGGFVHVLEYPSLAVKEQFRVIYYEGEAAFGLMRAYGLTKDLRWLEVVEKAFEHFIAQEHWRAHDHWLSYCVNELTLYRPEERYYQFGIKNVLGYLDFVLTRITTFPTLLELMMAAEKMVHRLHEEEAHRHLLSQLDLDKFYQALEYRAKYLLNGHFWPEYAMYFEKPRKILGGFFIRHHAFRVRIDDVEHYLSGYVAYEKYLQQGGRPLWSTMEIHSFLKSDPNIDGPIVAWGGDVNLGRRQHYRTAELGVEKVLAEIPALNSADLSIVNLECVVATSGEQGVEKGEGSPYYYRARPEMLKILVSAGIDVVTTANNHSGDYGLEAVLEQGQWLDAVGIGYAGTGSSLNEALKPVIRSAGELNVAIFSLDATQKHFSATEKMPGAAYLPLSKADKWRELLAPRIAEARKTAHVVLVAVHWGANLEDAPGKKEIDVGHAIIDAGADAILGASAHVLQGIEIYQGRPIIHDAGDLLFDSVRRSLGDSGVFQLELCAYGVKSVVFNPIGIGFGFSQVLSGQEAIKATQKYVDKCSNLGTRLDITQSGLGVIELDPPVRPIKKLEKVKPTAYNLAPLTVGVDGKRFEVDAVPDSYAIDPVSFGPITLVGIRVYPKIIKRRQLLWVESFWKADAPVDEDARIDVRAIPTRSTKMPFWGMGMDHDPCDWQMPTSCWEPGVVYRDFYGLRAPQASLVENIDLQIEIRIISEKYSAPALALKNGVVKLDIPGASNLKYQTDFPEIIHEFKSGQTWDAGQLATITGGKWLSSPPEGWFVKSLGLRKSRVNQLPLPMMFVAHEYQDQARHEQYSRPSKEHWDRHDTLPEIHEKIVGAIVSKPVKGVPDNFPVLQVNDPIKAIIELGIAARQRFGKDVIAITGTAGKTSTVAILQQMLGGKERVLATVGNHNTRVGSPAILASLSPDYDAAVVEVAQSALWMKRGPITRLINPTIALITEIGVSQTDSRIKSEKDTAIWKSRIFDGLTGPAVAIVGEHLKCFELVLENARKHAKRVIVFGDSQDAEVRILSIEGDEHGSWVHLQTPSEKVKFRVPVPGKGMVHNAVAACCVLYAMGRELATGVEALLSLSLEEGRLQRKQLIFSERSVDIIDDSFNATISSMVNAFSVLAHTAPSGEGRKIAVLGRIVHLGEKAKELHISLAEPLLSTGVDWVVTHGDEMKHLRSVLPVKLLGPHFDTIGRLVDYLRDFVIDNDLVLIKGSRRESDFGRAFKLLEKASRESSEEV